MAILQTSSFTEEYKITTNRFSDLSTYFAKYEKYYLLRLLGAELYDLFVADLSGTPEVPGTSIYQTIFNPFHLQDGSVLHQSEGMVKMLSQFVYYHYVIDMVNQNTINGVVRPSPENAVSQGFAGYNLIEAYNNAVHNFCEIQWYIDDNPSDYPTYEGQYLGYTSGI